MSNDKYVWEDDFNSFFELNTANDYENLSKVTVAKTLNEQDQTIKDLQHQLKVCMSIAEEVIKIVPAHFDEVYGWSDSLKQLKEKGE